MQRWLTVLSPQQQQEEEVEERGEEGGAATQQQPSSGLASGPRSSRGAAASSRAEQQQGRGGGGGEGAGGAGARPLAAAPASAAQRASGPRSSRGAAASSDRLGGGEEGGEPAEALTCFIGGLSAPLIEGGLPEQAKREAAVALECAGPGVGELALQSAGHYGAHHNPPPSPLSTSVLSGAPVQVFVKTLTVSLWFLPVEPYVNPPLFDEQS